MTPSRVKIPEFKIEVCSDCQYDCLDCAHGELRRQTRHYHLSLNQIESFIRFTEESGYYIERLSIHGSGEPLLWKSLNEGLHLFKASNNINRIEIVSNGKALNRIHVGTWHCVDRISVSLYDDEQKSMLDMHTQEHMKDIARFYGMNDSLNIQDRFQRDLNKIHVNDKRKFWPRHAGERDASIIPCICSCAGPMLLGNKVFLYCGPPVFSAAAIIDVDIWESDELYVGLKRDYLDAFRQGLRGNMDLCRYCWANHNYQARSKVVSHVPSGGKW